MKKILNYLVPGTSLAAIVFAIAAFSNSHAATQPQSSNINSLNMLESQATPAVQPVDLTAAADKALPSVVHIKYVQNSKIQTVEVQTEEVQEQVEE